MESFPDSDDPGSFGTGGKPLPVGGLESRSDLFRGRGSPHQAWKTGNPDAAGSGRLLLAAESRDSLWAVLRKSCARAARLRRQNQKGFTLRQIETFVEFTVAATERMLYGIHSGHDISKCPLRSHPYAT